MLYLYRANYLYLLFQDLDRFEMAAQGREAVIDILVAFYLDRIVSSILALEYETKHNARTLQPFFDSSLPIIRHPEIKCWGADLSVERDRLHAKPDEHSLSTIGHTIYSGKMCASSFPPKQA